MVILSEKDKKIIKKRFPKYKKLKIYNGFDFTVVLLDNFIVRIPKNKESRNKIKNEEVLLNFLKSKLNLLTPVYINKDKELFFYKAFIGKEFSFNFYKKLKLRDKNKIYKELGIFLKKLHSISIPVSIKNDLLIDNWSKMFISIKKDVKKYVFSKIKKNDEILFDVFFYIFEKSIKKMENNCFVHGDFTGDNIIVDFKTNKIQGIIDFGDSRFSDPAVDFYYFWFLSDNFVYKIVDYYTNNKELKNKIINNSKLYFLYINLLMTVVYAKNNNKKMFNKHLNIFKKALL